jgi:hypothetical protein
LPVAFNTAICRVWFVYSLATLQDTVLIYRSKGLINRYFWCCCNCTSLYSVRGRTSIMTSSVAIPPNAQNHGDSNLICLPPIWTDYFIFFATNYFAHAATLVSQPGESIKETLLSTANACSSLALGHYVHSASSSCTSVHAYQDQDAPIPSSKLRGLALSA